jgi:glucose-6-phosphate 1-dehydrogenase
MADHSVFVRPDEAIESWKLFDPILEKIEKEKIKPIPYKYGSSGPKEAEKLIEKYNFKLNQPREWEAKQGSKL